MNCVSTISRIKPLLRGNRWRAGVMLIWAVLFVMTCNDYIHRPTADGMWFIGVFLFCVLFPSRHRGQVLSDPYRRSDDAPSLLQRFPYGLIGRNHGGELPHSSDDRWSTSSISYTPMTYSHDSSSSSVRWESSHDSYQSSSSFRDISPYDTSHLFRNDF